MLGRRGIALAFCLLGAAGLVVACGGVAEKTVPGESSDSPENGATGGTSAGGSASGGAHDSDRSTSSPTLPGYVGVGGASGVAGGGGGPSTGGFAGAPGDGGVSLPELPDNTYPYCTGPKSGGSWNGPCCARVLCIKPTCGCKPGDLSCAMRCAAGEGGVCPAATSSSVQGPDKPESCKCAPPQGPFEATPGLAPQGSAGSCCYVVSSASCEAPPIN